MQLNKITNEFINIILDEYSLIEGDELNQKLLRLFKEFKDDTNKFDVLIKVAALNKIYSTAITNINPVVDKINSVALNYDFQTISDYINFIDKISIVKWENKNEKFERKNLSFASKYVHFSSNLEIPIYDSYIWIIIKGYLGQYNNEKLSFSIPQNYSEFYSTYSLFKKVFKLEAYSNYMLDKFLWTYGRKLIFEIRDELKIDIEKAKSELKKRIKEY